MSVYDKFKRTWDDGKHGFGRHSYDAAIAAGYTPQQIAAGVSGQRVGQRAQDMINAAQAAYSSGQSAANDRAQEQINNLNNQISGYTNQITNLQGQYNTALGQVQEWTDKANEFEGMFNDRTREWEEARDEAAMYREQAVGQQLRALRGGATSGGGNQTGGSQSLASGRSRYSAAADDKAVEIEKNIKAESGALSRKGNVVQAIRRANTRGGGGQRPQQSAQAGSGSYYASRFG